MFGRRKPERLTLAWWADLLASTSRASGSSERGVSDMDYAGWIAVAITGLAVLAYMLGYEVGKATTVVEAGPEHDSRLDHFHEWDGMTEDELHDYYSALSEPDEEWER